MSAVSLGASRVPSGASLDNNKALLLGKDEKVRCTLARAWVQSDFDWAFRNRSI